MILDPAALGRGEMYRFMIGVIAPRPIAFVSTRSAAGVSNLAPFSYFTPVADQPPLLAVIFAARRDDPKDSLRNIRETNEFVVNIVSEPLLDAMVRTSGDWPRGTSEFAVVGLTEGPSERVHAPSVAESPVQFECRLHREIELGSSVMVVGEVLLARAADAVITDGTVDPLKLLPVGRLGGDRYALTREVVRRSRPKVSRLTGEEG